MESEFPLRNRTDRGEGFANALPRIRGLHRRADRCSRSGAAGGRGAHRCRVAARATRDRRCPPLPHPSACPHAEPHHGWPDDDEPVARQPPALAAHDRRARRGDAGRSDAARSRHRGEPARQPADPVRRPRLRARDRGRGLAGGRRRTRDRRDGQREPRRTGLRRRRALPGRPAQRGPTPQLRLRPARVPRRHARRAVARIGVAAYLDRFGPGALALEPGFEFENVSTFFEVGPRRLPVVPG